uniref:Uncharacterized protein n=1 Tax=Oryza sativa subsp. japonica TaxID=39947 RepID=Q5VRT0_ORYSJ|nr:hypothetical protein [Oryza sativa Japonica Group]
MERFRSAWGPSSVGSVGTASNARTRGPPSRRAARPPLRRGPPELAGRRAWRELAGTGLGGSEGCRTRRGLLPVGELEDERGAEEEDEGKGIEADLWVPHCFLGCKPRWYAT